MEVIPRGVLPCMLNLVRYLGILYVYDFYLMWSSFLLAGPTFCAICVKTVVKCESTNCYMILPLLKMKLLTRAWGSRKFLASPSLEQPVAIAGLRVPPRPLYPPKRSLTPPSIHPSTPVAKSWFNHDVLSVCSVLP